MGTLNEPVSVKEFPLMTTRPAAHPMSGPDIVLRGAIVALTLATAYIHATLGGLLFLLNAAGYVTLAAAMVVPLPILTRHRSLVRLALIAFAAATIIGWVVDGPHIGIAYVAKAIEVVLVALLLVELIRSPSGRRPLAALCLALFAVVAVACGGGASGADDTASIDPNAVTISATNLTFSTSELSARAGRPFQIVFDNQESALHNLAIYTDSSASTPVFVEEPFGGPRREVYEVPALAPGTYFFQCDVHPDMAGTLTAE
jgi:plastocyanin